jgi:putative ABC transport system permease protein
MLKSYWKTAVRFLLKNKTFSFINIFGLAAGTMSMQKTSTGSTG